MSDARELHCEDCDRDYPVWFAPSPLWNAVVREPADAAGITEPFLCLTCFATRAEASGIRPTAWVVHPEADLDAAKARIAELEEAASAEKSRLYAIFNTVNGEAIRGWEGEPMCQEIIRLERERIDSYRTRTRKAEARIAELEAEVQQTLGTATNVARDAATSELKSEARVTELEAGLKTIAEYVDPNASSCDDLMAVQALAEALLESAPPQKEIAKDERCPTCQRVAGTIRASDMTHGPARPITFDDDPSSTGERRE